MNPALASASDERLHAHKLLGERINDPGMYYEPAGDSQPLTATAIKHMADSVMRAVAGRTEIATLVTQRTMSCTCWASR